MNNKYKNAFFSMLLMCPFVVSSNAINDSVDDNIVETGDMVQILLPAAGYFAAWMHNDPEGAKQLTYSTLSTQAAIHGMKQAVGRKRPNENSWNSFPSGHTGAAFSGAAFLQSRYGAEWGIPAYAAATFVGASRIHGNRHYAGDVVAGAGIAFLMNQYFVSPYRAEGVYFNAQPAAAGLALGVTLTSDVFNKPKDVSKSRKVLSKKTNHRLELGVGVNVADSSSKVGATNYLSDSNVIDELQPFSYINYGYQLTNDNEFELEFSPNETRRRGIVKQDIKLGGKTFTQGEEVLTAYRHWLLGSNVYKGFKVNKDFNLAVGLGLYVHMFGLDVALDQDNGKSVSQTHWRTMPSISAKSQYFMTKQVSAIAKTQYQSWANDSYLSAEIGLNYQLNPAWDVGFKYNYAQTELGNATLSGKYDANMFTFTFANRF